MNKLRSFIRVYKDALPKDYHNNVVYKISSNNCDITYVGQTSRFLKTQIKEHENHINRNTTQKSVITDHRLSNHKFDWDNIEIFDEEFYLKKRLVSEMLFIRPQRNGLNRQEDTEFLNHAYISVVKHMPQL